MRHCDSARVPAGAAYATAAIGAGLCLLYRGERADRFDETAVAALTFIALTSSPSSLAGDLDRVDTAGEMLRMDAQHLSENVDGCYAGSLPLLLEPADRLRPQAYSACQLNLRQA